MTDQRPRVAYVLNKHPTVSGTFITGEITALRARGWDVEVFSVNPTSAEELLTDAMREEHARVRSLRPVRLRQAGRALASFGLRARHALLPVARLALASRAPGLRGLGRQAMYIYGAAVVWDEARRRGIAHLHSHFAFQATDVAMLAAAIGQATHVGPRSFSFTVHGPDELMDLGYSRLAAKAARADAVVAISHFARSQVLAQVQLDRWDSVHRIHCGIDISAFPPADRGQRTGLQLLAVGRLVPVKGHAVLIHALALVLGERDDVRLRIVGDGPLGPFLRTLATDLGVAAAVTFEGAIGQDRMPSYYAEADVLCLSSFAEGLPMVLMEALATELPVVSTGIMGIPELVEDDVTGLVVPPGDAEALAAAVLRLAADPALRHGLARAGRARVQHAHSVHRSAEQVADLFASLLASHGDLRSRALEASP